jgi:hypothetical protein
VAAFFAVLAALGLGALLAIPLAVAPAALMGVLTRAWRRGRQRSWWASSVLAFSGLAFSLAEGWGPGAVPGVVLNAGFLLLLSHPDCRQGIHAPVEDIRPERDPAGAWVGRDY